MAGGWFLRREHVAGEPKPLENLPRILIGSWAVLAGGLTLYLTAAWAF